MKCFTKMPVMRKVADSTVRRLSLYLRFLEEFEGQGIGDRQLGRARVPGQHHLGAGAEGPLVLRLVRQARAGLSGARAGRPAARDPGTQAALPGGDDRGGEDRQRAGAIPWLPAARLRHRRHLRQRSRQDRPPVERAHRAGHRPARGGVRPAPDGHGRAGDAGRGGAGGGRPADPARRQGDPQLRAGAAGGAGRRRGQDGQPRARARDAQLRAGQSSRENVMSHTEPER